MILYFTGTGNSQYIAKRMKEKTSDDMICINDRIKRCVVCNELRRFDWKGRSTQPGTLRKKELDVYGNGTNCHAGELHCHVPGAG